MHRYRRLVTLTLLGCCGLALMGCLASDLIAGPDRGASDPPYRTTAFAGERITLDNANRVARIARLSEGPALARAAWSPDGSTLALPSAYGVYLFDAKNLKQIRFIPESVRVQGIAYSPDGTLLATGGSGSTSWAARDAVPPADHSVRLWRVGDGSLVREFPGESWAGPAVFSPDNSQVVTRGAQDTVRLWRVSDGMLVREFLPLRPDDRDKLVRVAFSRDWSMAVAVSTGPTPGSPTRIRVWRVGDAALLREVTEAQADLDQPENIGLAPDGKLLVSTHALYIKNALGQPRSGTAVRLWRVSDGGLEREWKEERITYRVHFTPDGALLASQDNERLRLRRVSDGSIVRDLNGAFDTVSSPDGKLIASRNEQGTFGDFTALRVWRISDGALVREMKERFEVDGVNFGTDGNLLAAGRLWRVSDGPPVLIGRLQGLADHVDSVAFSRDGDHVATGGLGNWRLWRTSDGALLHAEQGLTGHVSRLAFSPDASLLAVAGDDHSVQLWQTNDGRRGRAWHGLTENVTGMVFSPDATLLAVATRNTLEIWKVGDGTLVREVKGGWRSVSFSPDGSLLATTHAGGTLGLWYTHDGSLARDLPVADVISGTAFNSDGSLLAVAYMGGTLRLWQVSDGRLVREIKDPYYVGYGESITFSRDDRLLVSGNDASATIALWGIPPTR